MHRDDPRSTERPPALDDVDREDDARPDPPAAGDDDGFDPFAPVEASPRFATPLAVVAILLGVLAAIGGLAPIAGPVGMGVGLVAHVKGSRLGMPATAVAAVGMVVGMALSMYLR